LKISHHSLLIKAKFKIIQNSLKADNLLKHQSTLMKKERKPKF